MELTDADEGGEEPKAHKIANMNIIGPADAMETDGASKAEHDHDAHLVENTASGDESASPAGVTQVMQLRLVAKLPRLTPVEDARTDGEKGSSTAAADRADGGRGDDGWTGLFLDRLKSDPGVAQIVATTGGLVTYWNDAFAAVTRSSASLNQYPITIFELIESTSLGLFYGMLALALEGAPRAPSIVSDGAGGEGGDDDEEEEEEEPAGSSHLSITLPCRRFRGADARYNITIIYMDDLSSKCFVGILTPQPRPAPSPPRYIRFRTKKRRRISSSFSSEGSTPNGNEGEGEGEDLVEKPTEPDIRGDERYRARLPSGEMLRLYDAVLCRMIFGYD
ncbi:hypothetical protein ACHAXT_003763 [Thalassiosira profunda]